MHEYSIISNLLQTCLEHIESNNAKSLTKVVVSVGQRANIEPSLLESAFEVLKCESNLTRNAKIAIITQELLLECRICKNRFHSLDNPTCQACGSKDTFIAKGRDIMLESLELELD